MEKSRNPTIIDVAKEAGVSPITASRALNNSPLVAQTTHLKVKRAAEKLNYVPNLLARSLVKQSTNIIGIVVINLANPYYDWIVHAAQQTAKERGYNLLVGQSTGNEDVEMEFLTEFQQIQIAGLLLCPTSIESKQTTVIQNLRIPTVFIGCQWPKGDFIAADNETGGRLAAEHLIRLGFKKIGLIYHQLPKDGQIPLRCKGFEQKLHSVGITIPKEWHYAVDQAIEDSGIEPADYYLSLMEKPEVFFITDDQIALSFMHRLKNAHINIPKDLAVIGYNDIEYSAYVNVPLTTIALPKKEMGKRATNLLIDRIEGKIPSAKRVQEIITPKLVVRQSCGSASRTTSL